MKTSICVLLALLLGLAACKKDNSPKSRKVEYKAAVSAQSQTQISSITYTDTDGSNKTVSLQRQTQWDSGEIIVPGTVKSLYISAQAPGANIVPAMSLTVQIYVDGVLKQENVKVGPNNQGIMIATANY